MQATTVTITTTDPIIAHAACQTFTFKGFIVASFLKRWRLFRKDEYVIEMISPAIDFDLEIAKAVTEERFEDAMEISNEKKIFTDKLELQQKSLTH